ncbi:MAG TPA: hypothetical protein PLG60_06255, partial [Acidimicrobiales bacterium]|nr:hypothetical protein [Acidimicrobiales bacterium]
IENEPSVRIVALLAGNDVDEHEATLRGLVTHPGHLEVHRSDRYARAYLDSIAAEVRRMATITDRGSFRSWGIGAGKLNIVVRASRQDLAQRLLDAYGDAVRLRVGFLSYPDPTMIDTHVPQHRPPAPEQPPLLAAEELQVSVAEGLEVQSGGHLGTVLHVHNVGTQEIVVLTNGAVTAVTVDPRTGSVVGGYEFAQHMPEIEFRIPPGDIVDIPLLVGTAAYRGRRLSLTDVRTNYLGPTEASRRCIILDFCPSKLRTMMSLAWAQRHAVSQ